MSYLSLNFALIRKEEKIKVDLPKSYGASQYIKRLPYISREDLNFQNSIIDIINNRSDLRKCLLATSDYGRNIRENINSLVDGGKFNQAVVCRVLDQKNKGVFESPTPLSATFKDVKKFDIENPILGNLLTQVIANQVNDKTVRELLGNIKDDKIQRRLDELRRDTDNNNDNYDNINFNFDHGDDNDNDDDMDVDGLLHKYDNLTRCPIPKPRAEKYEDELLHRYNRLKPKTDESHLLCKFDKLKKPVFRDIRPSPPPPLKRKDYSDDEESLILPELPSSPPQPPPRPDILQTNFDRPITNVIDKAKNVIEIVPKNKKEELDKLDLHLPTQLSKLFPEVEYGTKIIDDKNDEKIN